jgi:hypothetical protein
VVGRVLGGDSHAAIAGAFVVVELGGLDRLATAAVRPDGGAIATVVVDPFVRYGARTDDAGAFALTVPAGPTGLHAFAPSYLEKRQVVEADDASVDGVAVSLDRLPSVDGAVVAPPLVKGLSVSSSVVGPSANVTFAAEVAAGSPGDPLCRDIFLVEPTTRWAGALSPPTAVVADGPYPDGVYGRIVQAPSAPGVYTYTVVVASMGRVTGAPASVVLTVTSTGAPPLPDASIDADGSFPEEGGGLPDGRH